MKMDYILGKRLPDRYLALIQTIFKEKIGDKNIYIQSGIKNIFSIKDFFKLYDVWPVYLREDIKQSILATLVFIFYPHYHG